mmetsp:Transcript_2088/g.4527  ORF Transcript_2088/g.4527 Transcript_2088/m.4527 type:complete len:158 (-) Transcript_2088:613-1086(-)
MANFRELPRQSDQPVLMAASEAEAVPNGEPAAAKVQGGKWPPGVERLPNIQPIATKTKGTKYYARLRWLPPGATKRYDTIPGLYPTPTAAAEALGAAQALLISRGVEAVWPKGVPGSKATKPRTIEAGRCLLGGRGGGPRTEGRGEGGSEGGSEGGA